MAGTLLNKEKMHEERIRIWMDAIVSDGGIDRYDDLHIDQIDDNWKSPEIWLSASLEALKIAARLHDENVTVRNFTLALAFSLQADERPKGANFNTTEEIKGQFYVTPPSLYLLRRGAEFWTHVAEQVTVKIIEPRNLFVNDPVVKKCIYMEFKRSGSDSYTRSLFLVA